MTQDEKKIIRNVLDEFVDSLTRIAAEKDLQKEMTARIKEETTIAPRVFRKMAKVAFASNFSEEVALHEEFEETYQEIIGG